MSGAGNAGGGGKGGGPQMPAQPAPGTPGGRAPARVLSERELRDKLTQARAKLLLRHPFFGYLVSNLEDRVGVEWLATAGTDGAKVHWSDAFLSALSDDDTMFVLGHEAMHCALLHLWRRQGRDPRKWNVSCDAAVNDMLLEAGLKSTLPMIRGARGRSAEELYEDFDELVRANSGQDTLDDHEGWTEGKPGDPEQRQRADQWRAALGQARSFGKVPAGLARQLEDVLSPKRDWRDLLRDGLFFPEDYRWVPTDRRFSHVLLPTLTGEVHRVVVAIDTSGSIFGDKLRAFWTELVAILRNNRCEARVLTCDAAIQDEFDELQFDPANVNHLRGGGGTSFVPVFERVEQYMSTGWRPEAVVYLTDLDGSFPSRVPEVRTIWVVEKEDGRKTVPFGEVIVLE